MKRQAITHMQGKMMHPRAGNPVALLRRVNAGFDRPRTGFFLKPAEVHTTKRLPY